MFEYITLISSIIASKLILPPILSLSTILLAIGIYSIKKSK